MPEQTLLIDILCDPAAAANLAPAQWDRLIRQARHANLLGKLHRLLEQHQLLDTQPDFARRHTESAWTLAQRQHQTVRIEALELAQALSRAGLDLILLKGAAYVLADLPAAKGRVFADIDLLVPHARLHDAESTLMLHGWKPEKLSDYDARYYRQWMHELPPMTHMFRLSSIDVHHTILPPTSRYHPDPARLIAKSCDVTDLRGIKVLQPVDMVIHSITHLFHEGEPDNALRDLTDIDTLLCHFGAHEPNFWVSLIPRARELSLQRPLWYGLHYCQSILATPIPAQVIAEASTARVAAIQPLMDFIFRRIFRPNHSMCDDGFSALARNLQYLRGHWLRMPPHLLTRHLLHKIWYRLMQKDENTQSSKQDATPDLPQN